RKRLLLVHLHNTFAHQLERRCKARREYRRRQRRLDDERDQILVEAPPIVRATDQPLERVAGLRQRPYGPLGQAHMPQRRLLPLLGVSRKQVIQCRRPLWPSDVSDGLGLATAKDITIELRPPEQALSNIANGLQASEPKRERRRHVLGALSLGRVCLRQ